MASDDEIAIDIVPTLDERATRKTLDKLKERTNGAGTAIGGALGSEFGQEFGRTLGPALRGHIKDIATELGGKLGSALGEGVHGAAADIGIDLDKVLGKAKSMSEALGVDADSVTRLSDSFKDFKSGDITKGIDDLAAAFGGKLPGPLQEVADKSKGLLDIYGGLRGDIKDVTTLFGDFTKKAPGVVGAFGSIAVAASELAGPLAADYLAASELINLTNQLTQNKSNVDPNKNPNGWWGTGFGVLGGPLKHLLGGDETTPKVPAAPSAPNPANGGNLLPSLLGPGGNSMGGLPDPLAPLDKPSAHTSSASGGGIHAQLVDFTTPVIPGVSSMEDLAKAGGGVRALYGLAEAMNGTPYSQALRDDCSGMVSRLASEALGLGDLAPGQRFTTANEGEWLGSHGFSPGMGGPGDISIGWYDHGGGNNGHTAATLPGGVHAESGAGHGFTLGPGAAGADNRMFDHHMHLPMTSPARGDIKPIGFGMPPPGLPISLGVFPPPPTSPNNQAGPVQAPGIGSGPGMGVGGGIAGLAEQGAAMMAGPFGPAAQVAEQEANLAVQKGGQMLATAAMAPIETAWLGGGMMGAPSAGQAPWVGKILGGLIGSQHNAPNTAGATQPPMPPQQKDEDPLSGGAPAGGGGPAGTKDDPIHVKSATPPAGPPQGTANSNLNIASMSSGLVL